MSRCLSTKARQVQPAPPRAADRSLIEQPLQGDLFVALPAGQNRRDWATVAFSTKVELGREAPLRAPQRLALIPR